MKSEEDRRKELEAKRDKLSMDLSDIQLELISMDEGTWLEDYKED